MIVAIIVGFSLFLVFGLWVNHNKAKQRFLTWNEIAGRLKPVPAEGIQALAMEQLHPKSSPAKRNHDEIWALVGGAAGLACMNNNAEVFMDLLSYAEATNPDEAAIVAGRMRQDGVALRRAVLGAGIAVTVGYGRSRMTAYVQDAASSYYLLRERLLELYRTTGGSFYPLLEAALKAGKQRT